MQLKAWEEYTLKLEEKYVALMTEHESFQRELASVRGILDDGTDPEIHGGMLPLPRRPLCLHAAVHTDLAAGLAGVAMCDAGCNQLSWLTCASLVFATSSKTCAWLVHIKIAKTHSAIDACMQAV